MSSLVCYRLGHALQQWDRYPRSTERISCLRYIRLFFDATVIMVNKDFHYYYIPASSTDDQQDYVSSCAIPLMPVMYQVGGFEWGDGHHPRVATGGAEP